MFRRKCSSDQQRAQERVVNTEEHLSKMSPAEIVNEMENIFLDNNSDDMDIDQLEVYLEYLDKVAPVEVTVDSYEQFAEKHASLLAEAHADWKPPRRKKTVIRRAWLVAAVLFVVVGACSIAYAGYTPFAQWVNETLSFSRSPDGSYTSLQEALDAYGIKERLLPKWLPQVYYISDVKVMESEASNYFFAQYLSIEDPNDVLTITVRENLLTDVQVMYEKDSTIVDELLVGSTTYYIGRNNELTTITWAVGVYECSVSGMIEEEDISKIINSIA